MTSERQGANQLKRLTVLLDVVFALVLWRIFQILPRPGGNMSQWVSVFEMLKANWIEFVYIVLSTLIVIVFWVQNNSLLGKLKRTDAAHTGIMIFQMIFLLLVLYSISLGIQFEGEPVTKVMESVSTMLVGLCAYAGWRYALYKGNLIADDVSADEAQNTLERNMAEPITAALTIPFVFVGPLAWELSWFIYPLLKSYLKRKKVTPKPTLP